MSHDPLRYFESRTSVNSAEDPSFDPTGLRSYSPQEIVDGVIADWLAGGGGDLEWGDFWFALPETYGDKT